MQLSNQPKLKQDIRIAQLAIVSTVVLGVLAISFFLFGGVFSPKDTLASGYTISAGTSINASSNPFSGLSSGDTLMVYGTFRINQDYSMHSNKAITIVVNGSGAKILFKKRKDLILGTGSSIVLINGGTLDSYDGCDGGTSIYIGSTEVADCSGGGSTPSFSDINTAGGIGSNGSPLPVEWLKIDAKAIAENEIKISWSTASELNNSHFTVEYSTDAQFWQEALTVNSAAPNGNSNEILEYSANHIIANLSDKYYYRIKQTDFNGEFDYSTTMVVDVEMKQNLVVSTLGNNKIGVRSNTQSSTEQSIKIYALDGALMHESNMEEYKQIELPKAGAYFIEIGNGSQINRIKHFVK